MKAAVKAGDVPALEALLDGGAPLERAALAAKCMSSLAAC
jgi:hypothetical protein